MKNRRTVLPSLFTGLAVAVLAVATPGATGRQQQPTQPNLSFVTFEQRVDDYVRLHRTLAASLPPLASRNRQSVVVARHFLASAIKAARPHARQGDVFDGESVPAFRAVLRDTTRAADFGMLSPLMDENGRLLPGLHPAIHEPFPVFDSRELPAVMVAWLPTLPEELEYRVVDYDLVLWDVYADLVVDVIPYAVAHPWNDLMYR